MKKPSADIIRPANIKIYEKGRPATARKTPKRRTKAPEKRRGDILKISPFSQHLRSEQSL